MSAAEADAWLGDLQRRMGRDTEAARRIEAAVAREPALPICQVALGLLRLTQDRWQEGVDALNRADALGRDDFLTQFVRGVALLRANGLGDGNTASAARALARAVALNPGSSEAYAWLAYAQMQTDETLDQARASIEHAIELAPGRLDYRLRYADIRILQGQPNEVRPLLSAIASIKTDPPAAARAKARIDAMLASMRRPVDGSPGEPRRAPRSVPTPSVDSEPAVPDTRVHLQLRQLHDDEQRTYGLLTRVDCSPTEVRFHVQTADATLIAIARRMEDVELIAYLDSKHFVLTCGGRTPADPVLLTRRPDGTAVAVEFVPRSYTP